MRLRLSILAFLCHCTSLFAQKPLSIGDAVPDLVFRNLLNHSSPTARLSDFKGKLVLLDFWATWCTSCLKAFPKIDSLQTTFEEKLKVILVNTAGTGDDLAKVQASLSRYQVKTGKALPLTIAVGDTVSFRFFPHQLLPHYVWIAPSGRVVAITSSEAVTAQAIQDVLDGISPSFTMKKDQDTDRPLFSGEDQPSTGLLNNAVLVKGWFDGLPSGNKVRRKDSVTYGRAMSNTALLDMYKTLARGLNPSFTERHLVMSPEDSACLLAPPSGSERTAWYRENAYTLDVIVPLNEAPGLLQRMLDVLNQYSGYTGRFEERKMRCWVLSKSVTGVTFSTRGGKTVNRLWDKANPSFANGTMAMLVDHLNNGPAIQGLVINETGYTGKLDLAITGSFADLTAVQENLSRNGLVLKQAERTVRVFVLRKN